MKALSNINYSRTTVVLLFSYVGMLYFSFAISNILFGITAFTYILGVFNKEISFHLDKKKLLYYLLIISPFILTFLSAILSNNFEKGIEYVWFRFPIVVIPLIVLTTVNKRDLQYGMRFFVYFSIIATLTSFYNAFQVYLNNGVILNPDFTKFITPIQHPYFGMYQLVSLVFVGKMHLFYKPIVKRIVIAILIIGIVLSTSRLVYLLFVFLLLLEIISRYSLKKRILLIVVLLTSLFTLVNVNDRLHDKVFNTFDYWKSPRIWFWHNSFKILKNTENPILGIGIGDYYTTPLSVDTFQHSKEGTWGYNPHNQYIEFLITNGIFGMLFLFSMGYLFYLIRKKKKAAIYIFFIIISFAFTESIFNRLFGIAMYAVFLPSIFSIKEDDNV